MSDLHDVTVTPVIESMFGLDGGAMFGIIPRPLWQRTNPPDEANRIQLAARCLLLDAPGHRILVDAGMGGKWSPKERGIYDIAHPAGRGLCASLRATGVEPETITDVVLTHLHFDHAGGLTWRDEEGALHATFPAAVHWVQRENWVWAHHPSLRDAGSYRRENFALLGVPGGPELRLVDGPARIVEDTLEVRPTRGHTPGMQMVRFVVDGTSVIYVADILPTLGHLQLPYVMGYDVYPMTTVREKRDMLEDAIDGDWIIALEHDPDVGFARIERRATDKYRVAASAPTLGDLLEA